jgi:hypothetical protein
LILHTASHRSKGHSHRLLSALLHGPLSTAGLRLAAVFRDQDFLATTPEEMYAAPQNFSAPSLTTASHDLSVAPIVHVSHDAPDILEFGQVHSSDALSIAFPVFTRSRQGSMAVSGSDLLRDATALVIPIVLPPRVPTHTIASLSTQ